MTPARIASSMRLLKRRRRMKDRRMIADETNNNKNKVARKVNLFELSIFVFVFVFVSDVKWKQNTKRQSQFPPACRRAHNNESYKEGNNKNEK